VSWRPHLGAFRSEGGITFRVWAPLRRRVEVVLNPGRLPSRRRLLRKAKNGMFTGTFGDVVPGDLYAYLLDDQGPFPDPASRFQPDGVHGPSAVVAPWTYDWSDAGWRGIPLRDAVIPRQIRGNAPSTRFSVDRSAPTLEKGGARARVTIPCEKTPVSFRRAHAGGARSMILLATVDDPPA